MEGMQRDTGGREGWWEVEGCVDGGAGERERGMEDEI